jgi:hypothetical protein
VKSQNVLNTFEHTREVTAVLNDCKHGAGDGDRTRDIQLGKLAFYPARCGICLIRSRFRAMP